MRMFTNGMWLSSRASVSRLEVLAEPVSAALPAVRGRRRVEGGAIVREETVLRARIDHELDVRIVLLHEIAQLPRVGRRRARVELTVEPEERDLDVLGHVEARDGRGLVWIGARRRAV